MPSIFFYESLEYEGRFASLMTSLRAEGIVRDDVNLDLCQKWFVDNQVYQIKDIDF